MADSAEAPAHDPHAPAATGEKPTRRWPALDIVTRADGQVGDPDADAAVDPGSQPRQVGVTAARTAANHTLPQEAIDPPRWLRDAHPAFEAPPDDGSFEGFLVAFLDDYSPTAIVDPPEPPAAGRLAWRVFFPSADLRDAARDAIAAGEWQTRVDAQAVDVDDESWAERSQASLSAIHIDRLIIAPPWDVPASPPADTTVIVIEPSMGFGTGHHQSTRLCLRALQRSDPRGRRVLDLGTGSGVLAIAAAMLGAADVRGLDDDPDAVDAARNNVVLNGVGAVTRIERADLTQVGGGVASPPAAADVVLANLTGALLVRYADAIVRPAAPGGLLILSGFTEDERFAVGHAFRDLDVVADDREDGWIGLTLRRRI